MYTEAAARKSWSSSQYGEVSVEGVGKRSVQEISHYLHQLSSELEPSRGGQVGLELRMDSWMGGWGQGGWREERDTPAHGRQRE